MIKCTILLDKKGFRIFFENLGSTDDGRESSEQIIYFKMKILDLDATTCIELILFLLYYLLISQYYAFQESQSLYVCVYLFAFTKHCTVYIVAWWL